VIEKLSLLAVGSLVALTFALAGRAAANPSTSQPSLPLAVRDSPISSKLVDRLMPLDRQASQKIEALDARFARGELNAPDFMEFGDLAVANYLMRFYGQQLSDRGEAAGADFLRRTSNYDQRLRKIVAELRKSDQFRPAVVEQLLTQVQSAVQPKLPELTKRVEAQHDETKAPDPAELERLEQELLQILAEFERYGIWLEGASRFSAPYKVLFERVRQPLAVARGAQLAAELEAAIANEEPRYAELLQRIDAATAELRRTGQAPWNGQTRAGPELIGLIIAHWQAAHQRALRQRALFLIRRGGNANLVEPILGIQDQDAEFARTVRSAVADLVEADTARADSGDVSRLYIEYVEALALPLVTSDRAAWLETMTPVLEKLAAKDSLLVSEVRAYADSTDELLRWRRRVALARGLHWQKTKFPELRTRITDAVRNRLNEPALLLEGATLDSAALLGPAPPLMRRLQRELVGQPAAVPEIVGAGGGKALARYGVRTYVRLHVPLSPHLAAEAEALRKALLVTEDSPPLTLEAAAALAAAREDSYVRAGGQIQEVHLEPLLTRFATLSELAVGLSPPDRLPSEPLQTDLRPHVLLRCDLAPAWVQHECFAVMLIEPPATSPAAP
jgi:hypothetical protein